MMKHKPSNWFTLAAAFLCVTGLSHSAVGQVLITNFSNFDLDGKFASWGSATITSGPEDYRITSSGGFGSGFEDIVPNIDATGMTHVELTLTIAGGAGPTAGPIVSFVDGDGTYYNYAWFGQENGTRTLTANLSTPTFITNAGSIPGLDLTTLDFFHLQNDPGGYNGPSELTFDNLQLIVPVPEPGAFTLIAGALGGIFLIRRRRS